MPAKRRQVVLHIGTEKTGTKTLQHTLHQHHANLQAQGIYYLTTPGRIEARSLAAAVLCDDVPDDYLAQQGIHDAQARVAFRRQVTRWVRDTLAGLPDNIHTIVISSEHFHSRLRRPVQLQRLREMLDVGSPDFRVVGYLRRQVDLLASYHSTELKNGGTRSLQEAAQALCRPQNPYYHYADLLERWAEAFGSDAISPACFTAREWHGGELVQDFLVRSGLTARVPGLALTPAPVHNESLMPAGQALLLVLNRTVAKADYEDAAARQWQPLRERLAGPLAGKGATLSREQAVAYQAPFEPDNLALCRRWFGERECLFEPLPVDYGRSAASSALLTALQPPVRAWVAEARGREPQAMMGNGVNRLRDAAVALEKRDLATAAQLMALAQRLRPQGPFINRKLSGYRRQLGIS